LSFSIKNNTKKNPPRVRFALIKDEVLGKDYELSLVFVGSAFSRKLNRILRGKDRPTNVLSFNLSETHGEVFMDLGKIQKEVKKFAMPMNKLCAYLFIHGLLHLKGMEHGAKMEQLEQKILNGATNRSWY
jgi:probable rRNA maturation factor